METVARKQTDDPKVPDIVRELREIVDKALGAVLTAEVRPLAVQAVCEEIESELGGRQFYIPMNFYRSQQMALEVYEAWDTAKPDELAKRHRISIHTVYKFYKRGRRISMKRRQGDLFPESFGAQNVV
jgi:Mor family transcriptional regulator